LIIPDLTAQVGMKYKLPIIAQWGYNDGMPVWKKYEPGKPANHFTYMARVRGYPLGAHSQFLAADTQPEPEPKDLGYLFPRQYPIWSARFVQKDDPGKVVRTRDEQGVCASGRADGERFPRGDRGVSGDGRGAGEREVDGWQAHL
jgi:hypothetical protein